MEPQFVDKLGKQLELHWHHYRARQLQPPVELTEVKEEVKEEHAE